jgi:hypothetical protein
MAGRFIWIFTPAQPPWYVRMRKSVSVCEKQWSSEMGGLKYSWQNHFALHSSRGVYVKIANGSIKSFFVINCQKMIWNFSLSDFRQMALNVRQEIFSKLQTTVILKFTKPIKILKNTHSNSEKGLLFCTLLTATTSSSSSMPLQIKRKRKRENLSERWNLSLKIYIKAAPANAKAKKEDEEGGGERTLSRS